MIMGEKTRNANHYLNVNNFDLHVSSFEFLSSMSIHQCQGVPMVFNLSHWSSSRGLSSTDRIKKIKLHNILNLLHQPQFY